MKVLVSYLGSTSSGRMHKYAVIFPEMEEQKDATGAVTVTKEAATLAAKDRIITGLKAAGVSLNPNLGVEGFLSSTHLHKTPTVGAQAEVDVKGYHDQQTDRQVNYFADIDKVTQRDFAKRQQINVLVGEVVMVETALESKGSAIDAEKFERIQLLKAQQRKIEKEISAIVVAEG